MALYHSVEGSVGYTIVGTPTIVDGVVSGFSGSSYLQSSTTFPGSTATSLEFSTKFKISSLASTSTIVSSTTATIPFHLNVRDSKFRLYPGRENAYKASNFVLSANTDYFIKLFWDSADGWKLQYSTDGINYTTDFENYKPSDSYPRDNYIVFGRNYPNSGSEAFLGSIDLNHTYIKVNGQAWLGVCPVEVQKHQLMGPVGYTLTGNATVTDGVLGNLDTSSTAYVSSDLPEDYNKIEMVFKLGYNTTATTSGYLPICGFGGSLSQRRIGWNFTSGGGLVFKTSNSADALSEVPNSSLNPVTTLNNNGFIFVKMLVEKINANYNVTISASADGTNWINGQTGQTDTDPIGGRSIYLLRNTSGAASGRPTMDLNESYIKVNGKLWFWQPRETERIVVNGVEVWTKPVPPTPPGPVIDSNTVSLFHLDDNLKDEVSGTTYTTDDTVNYVAGKWDKGAYLSSAKKRLTFSQSASLPNDDFTIDCWIAPQTSNQSQILWYPFWHTVYNQGAGFYFRPASGDNEIVWAVGGSQGTVSWPTTVEWDPTKYFHVAVVNDVSGTGKIYLFVNGYKAWERSVFAVDPSYDAPVLCNDLQPSLSPFVEEYRFSDIARWTADFTPPTEPYGGN